MKELFVYLDLLTNLKIFIGLILLPILLISLSTFGFYIKFLNILLLYFLIKMRRLCLCFRVFQGAEIVIFCTERKEKGSLFIVFKLYRL